MNNVTIRCTNLEYLSICNMAYLLSQFGIYGESTIASKKGEHLHKILELLLANGYDIAKEYIDKNTPNDLKEFTTYFYEGLNLVNDFYKTKNIKPIYTEMSIKKNVELFNANFLLSGRIDLVAEIDKCNYIIDYKTSSIQLGIEKILSTHQLIFYAFLLYMYSQIKVNKSMIINIYGKKNAKLKVMEKEITPKDYEWLLSLLNLAYNVEKRGIFTKNYNSCMYCYLKEKCKNLPTVITLENKEHIDLLIKVKENKTLNYEKEKENEKKDDTSLFAASL